MAIDWTLAVAGVVAALVAGIAGTFIVIAFERAARAKPTTIFTDQSGSTIFLFDGETMVDSTPSARALLSASVTTGGPWIKVLAYLAPYFPDFEQQIIRLPTEGQMTLASLPEAGSPMILQAETRGGMTRLILTDPDSENHTSGQDLMTMRAMTDELDFLRATVSKAPVLIWRERANGDVVWANGAYLLRAGDVYAAGQEFSWPLPRLFERTASHQGIAGQRQKLTLNGGRTAWYDLNMVAETEGRLVFALPADAAVQAETGLRDFMQTLTKTFAHLHVGLAIFDHQRQLQLFNPALLDLTGLPVDFLSMRP